ncbi:membrane-bound lytic murein transglycosylase MltF [Desulfobacter hydrogenophilus]|uniref:Membrane-bound lytic murein transglycosylase MltF n=1 Tax=Desulfobacter hydrogenophilus TaxID=2291 RepID=A0A328FKY4_9BACT|nr:membrane-bound lytic murein transglycosylase MltF [Desulfobacter hydrogenophilus]NDY70603.1 membrane-bound lytic murein transglycosylase MltF [Desulfobacter hydrogenophilus]QBH13972.1 membrane-bound lytic murein transglycosylase MltF [Desulfobacter hydrogenophilus]RAM03615.1 membrane-bound lytic murein transglycosylase MltF [Desulfobacter hydrogenophilus]
MKLFLTKHFIFLFLIIATLGVVRFCVLIHHQEIGSTLNTVEKIRKNGKLRLITSKAINTYYQYNNKPTGFEYDLAREFAKFMNVELDVITPGWNNMFAYLKQGKGDFIAAGIPITAPRLEYVDFSIPYMTIQQRIIHHNLIFSPKDIKNMKFKVFHVRRGTSYHYRLADMKASGLPLEYVLHNNIPTEELIGMVHDREIKFTIANSNIALLSRRFFPDIRIGIPIQERESLAWAVRRNDSEMLKQVNKFFLYATNTGILKRITTRYYGNIDNFDAYELKKFHNRIKTQLPKYKNVIKAESAKHGFDWRLIAAIVYQESHFDPEAKSFSNVLGLMQVTEITAKEMGIKNRLDPQQSIRAGIKYLALMYKRFNYIKDESQRLLFALASYNIGYGHVKDAINLAKEEGHDPNTWKGIKATLPLLSKAKYYNQTKYGYARGWEPVQYVERIQTYFDILKQKKAAMAG